MNLWLRLIITLIKCCFAKKQSLLDATQLHFRVTPLDCDINIHLTNSRYFSFMDLGRLYHIAHLNNLFKTMVKNKWQPILSDVEMKFIKPVKPFARITLQTRLLTWDDRYIYMEQRFFDRKKLYAIALIKGIFLENRQRVTMERIFEITDEPAQAAPAAPLIIQHWKAMIEAKKTLE